jgi:anaphase-promoting complex subunit 1
MAAVTSLGVHTPVALPYLIAEGILPKDPSPRLYQWETYVIEDEEDPLEEEILATKNAVVWSQGIFMRNIYRFDLEGEDVIQAVLTNFPSASSTGKFDTLFPGRRQWHTNSDAPRHLQQELKSSLTGDHQRRRGGTSQPSQSQSDSALARALVVLLKTKAWIYFLQGGHHIVDLPFEVEQAFPAPRGLLLQRKRTLPSSLPPTPQLPSAPPNSFFQPQPRTQLSNDRSENLTC